LDWNDYARSELAHWPVHIRAFGYRELVLPAAG
jgi:hypothetical protein